MRRFIFTAYKYVSSFDLKTKKIKQWPAEVGETYTGFLTNKHSVYVNVDKLGLHIFEEDIKAPVWMGEKLFDQQIIFFFKYNKSEVIIGTDKDSLYMFNGAKLLPFIIESDAYLHESILAGGVNIDVNCFVTSTVTGGCLVIDKKTKKTKYTLNYQTGLSDDEIYSMGIDQNHGLWLLHEYGMSRVDLKLPIRNLNHYPGLEGDLTSIIDVDSSIFVSTSGGVFYLSEVENYEEIEVLVKRNEAKKEKEEMHASPELKKDITPVTVESEKEVVDTVKKKQKIWKRIFKKRKKKKKSKNNNEKPEVVPEKLIPVVPEKETLKVEEVQPKKREQKSKYNLASNINAEYESKKVYALQSISHKYNKIKGI